jgi:outer membrane protein assembly factor BamD
MSRRIPIIALLAVLLLTVACTNRKVNNPLANVGSKQPDKVLFDRAMNALKHNRYDVARLTLQTLINTYPDSEFIARAKLAVADSWYAEGGSTALQQAEIEYKDFETFFPNMPEAAEAQLKIANIHYQQMEKPDRDFTHAMRAEEEYRQLILQFPDSKLLPEAKQRLLEVQEVLGEREYRIGRFYYLRGSYPAGIARLRTVVDRYPLYSHADEALYLLGQSYEGQIATLRLRKLNEAAKARLIQEFTKGAAEAYSRILTRYPVMDRAEDAKARLIALHQPIPKPTKAAIAQNQAEDDSRRSTGVFGHLVGNFRKHPDVAEATKVGEPTLVDPKPMSATDLVQQASRAVAGESGVGSGGNSVAVETVGTGAPPPSQAVPRSDAPDNSAAPADSNELSPNVPADSNELKPNVPGDGGEALPSPQQVNEIQPGATDQSAPAQATGASSKTNKASSDSQTDDGSTVSSSKKKKKKGLRKLIPF